jgi:hypothetical protein
MQQPAYPQPYPQEYPVSPANAYYNPAPAIQPMSGAGVLSSLNSVWIHQEAQYLERCGCEFENVYLIYGVKDKEGEAKRDKDNLLFKCKEHSSCCQRYCYASSMRSFNMDVLFNSSCTNPYGQKESPKWVPFLHLERDYKCTCFCFNRPSIKVERVDDEKMQTIGYVTNHWAYYDFVYDMRAVEDSTGPYTIEGSCCQCGLCCSCPCGPCKKVDLWLYDSNKTKVGNISKVWTGLARTLFSDANSYCVTFAPNMSLDYKIMMVATTILIDFQHFEKSPADKKS